VLRLTYRGKNLPEKHGLLDKLAVVELKKLGYCVLPTAEMRELRERNGFDEACFADGCR
jgi:hypothetical protein